MELVLAMIPLSNQEWKKYINPRDDYCINMRLNKYRKMELLVFPTYDSNYHLGRFICTLLLQVEKPQRIKCTTQINSH
jgi:hypothetical protein